MTSPIPEALRRLNRAKVKASAGDSCWKGREVAVCSVSPLSGIRRTPELFPEDGDVLDTLVWEGVREALDDIRYTPLLRQYCRKALL